ncbi:hypothetical protein J5N97_023172 [Dioscorea zingiberensis]|uniref:Uncharacterized protein n=1 Tax=Dioscorea zingiberensis TaxID=325984 RepID=A0A9D5CCM7_9LILI|nr:hypothetical protein J5N97_023172 [Dioscorea zingiberensis]
MSSPWRRTPKHAGSRTPGYNTPGNTTPRRSSTSWFDTELASYLTPTRDFSTTTPRRSTASCYDSDFGPFSTTPRRGSATPRRPPEFIGRSTDRDEDSFYTYGTPRRRREAMEVVEIGTPKRVTMMGREIDMGGFRSPKPPSDEKNNWGGASPMISRNVPKESMETSYVRFNPLSDMDDDDEERSVRSMKKMTVPPAAAPPPPARAERKSKRRWWLSKLKWWKRGGRK